ncbi:MAG: HAD family hydrolase [Anaerolineae bacterium]
MTNTPILGQRLIPPLAKLEPRLVVFDKDGTLIDFHAMWGNWLTELARRLEQASGQAIAGQLYAAMSFDAAAGHIDPAGILALAPLVEIRAATVAVMRAAGLSGDRAEAAVAAAWHTPNPVTLAKPVTNLVGLFGALHWLGIRVAIATSDDRALTEATLNSLQLAPLVDALACADDGRPIKPAPDMLLALCAELGVAPAKTVMVGDNVPDMQMGRAAGAGLAIGVLSGIGSATDLAADADMLLPSIAEMFVGGVSP